MSNKKEGRVTGIGGIFFKTEDPKGIMNWYHKNLNLKLNEYGSLFEFRLSEQPDKKGYLQWGAFDQDTKYFDPSKKAFMINYRVENLDALLENLKKAGATILDEVASYEYGRFVHILDPEDNKIELWEPIDESFTKIYEGKTTK